MLAMSIPSLTCTERDYSLARSSPPSTFFPAYVRYQATPPCYQPSTPTSHIISRSASQMAKLSLDKTQSRIHQCRRLWSLAPLLPHTTKSKSMIASKTPTSLAPSPPYGSNTSRSPKPTKKSFPRQSSAYGISTRTVKRSVSPQTPWCSMP